MNLKTEIIRALEVAGVDTACIRIKYYKQSPYQKRRYKPEFVEQECWLYPKSPCHDITVKVLGKPITHRTHGICITASDWSDFDFRAMVISDAKHYAKLV